MRKSKLASSPLTRNETPQRCFQIPTSEEKGAVRHCCKGRGARQPPSFLSHPPSCALRRR